MIGGRIVVYDVPHEGRGQLGRDVWEFIYFERQGLVLDRFAHEERDTPRQKFKPRSLYSRLNLDRNYTITVERVTEEAVRLPDWVKERALAEFVKTIRVVKWSDK